MNKDRPSRTAYKVALNIITLSTIPGMDRVLPPGTAQASETLLIKSGVIGKKTAAFVHSSWAVKMYKTFDWMLPGQFEAFAYRKAFCEHQVREGIIGGAMQILVLGAGYDTLCWRLAPLFPKVKFFEIDHPNTARLKANGIKVMGRPENLFLIAQDLGEYRLADILKNKQGWDPGVKTVILAEGLVMYLTAHAVEGLFKQCAAICGVGSRLAFSYIPKGNDGRIDAGPRTGLMLWLQKLGGEPLIWSILPGDLAGFLKKTGWKQSLEHNQALQKYGVEYYAVGMK